MGYLVEATGATFHRNGERVFAPSDLALEPGRALVVLGANGSGKTTLLRLLAGILRPAEGRVERRGACAFLGHLPAVKGDLSCRENLQYEARLGAGGTPVDHALSAVGLAGLGLRPARTLSAGQKKRLGLARLLARHSPLWLLDEPYASLDDAGTELVDRMLADHLAAGGGAVLSTHQRLPRLPDAPGVLDLSAASPEAGPDPVGRQ